MSTVDELIEQGNDAENPDTKLARYLAALELEPDNPTAHYNIGLVYKYRGAWGESFKYNRRAVDLRGDEAERWNLAIAATALHDWCTAREMWNQCGMKIDGAEGPINHNFGTTPIRLDPDGSAEVVWAQRVCPVRARILNLPFPESGVAHGDVVLNDGAPVGYRIDSNGQEKAVFNMLEMFERGPFSTYVVELTADSAKDLARFEEICNTLDLPMEDWQATVRNLCRACSEGRPHESHDHEIRATAWQRERRVGLAARDDNAVKAALAKWNGEVTKWGVVLER